MHDSSDGQVQNAFQVRNFFYTQPRQRTAFPQAKNFRSNIIPDPDEPGGLVLHRASRRAGIKSKMKCSFMKTCFQGHGVAKMQAIGGKCNTWILSGSPLNLPLRHEGTKFYFFILRMPHEDLPTRDALTTLRQLRQTQFGRQALSFLFFCSFAFLKFSSCLCAFVAKRGQSYFL